jgi:Fe2+ transport system protein FeoA
MIKKLSEMKKNETGKITKFGILSEENLRKLLSLDLAPNAIVSILLSQPTIVIKSEYSEVAIDHFLAEQIEVSVN